MNDICVFVASTFDTIPTVKPPMTSSNPVTPAEPTRRTSKMGGYHPPRPVRATYRNDRIEILESRRATKRKFNGVADFTAAAFEAALDSGKPGPLGAIWESVDRSVYLASISKPVKTKQVIRSGPRLDEVNLCTDPELLFSILCREKTASKFAQILNERGWTRTDGNAFTKDDIRHLLE